MPLVDTVSVGLGDLLGFRPPLVSAAVVPFEVDNSVLLTAVFRLGLEAMWIQAEGDERLSFQVIELAEEDNDGGTKDDTSGSE